MRTAVTFQWRSRAITPRVSANTASRPSVGVGLSEDLICTVPPVGTQPESCVAILIVATVYATDDSSLFKCFELSEAQVSF